MSTLRLTTISNQGGTASVPSETVINGSAKAWVNFNGQGTVAIRASFNVSSITDNGTGNYTINLTSAMPDTNYTVFYNDHFYGVGFADSQQTGSYRVMTLSNSFANQDIAVIWSAVFRQDIIMSTLRVNTIQNVAGSGDPAINGAAKAWVNFNGTGTVAIRASFNVSSITDNGTGDYTVNFTNALTDANYSAVIQMQTDTTGTNNRLIMIYPAANALTTTTLRIGAFIPGSSGFDPTIVCAAAHR